MIGGRRPLQPRILRRRNHRLGFRIEYQRLPVRPVVKVDEEEEQRILGAEGVDAQRAKLRDRSRNKASLIWTWRRIDDRRHGWTGIVEKDHGEGLVRTERPTDR